MAGPSRSTFNRSSATLLRPREVDVPDPEQPFDETTSAPEVRLMSDKPNDESDDQKWSSLIEAASLRQPIVPLPGTAPPVRPVSESPRPAPIPDPAPSPSPPSKPAVPEEAVAAAAPPDSAPAVEPETPAPAVPEEAVAAAAPPDPAPVAEPEAPVAPKLPEDAPAPGVIGTAPRTTRRNGGLWLLAALFLLCALIAGAGLLQAARHARRLSQDNQQGATAEAPTPPPVAESQAAEPATPASAEAERPTAAPAQTASTAPAPAPNPPVIAPAAAVGRPVIVYHRRASPAADRLADQLRPLARQVDVRTATAIPRRPTIRYFQPEDAAAAQALAVALRRDGGEWRIQDRTARHRRHASGAVEVWLPDR